MKFCEITKIFITKITKQDDFEMDGIDLIKFY